MRNLATSTAGAAIALALIFPLVKSGHAAADQAAGVSISSLPGRTVPAPSPTTGTFTARILVATAVTRHPGGGRAIWVAGTRAKWSGAGHKLMVLGSRTIKGRQWLKVRLPLRPNGSSGWIRRDRVSLGRVDSFIEIDRSRRILRVFRKGKSQRKWRVVVGAESTPTPLGLFALYDRVKQRNPSGFIGPWAIPLTAHSDALRRYEGGPGLVALHGRSGASLLDPLGSAASHGCIRMNNGRIRYLLSLSMGTAVRIRR